MATWHIYIEGQVQGVGFRPFVFSLAQELGLKGWVSNTIDGVHIVFNADKHKAFSFKDLILAKAPTLSRITGIQINQSGRQDFTDFRIVHQKAVGQPKLLLTPDFALCKECRRELRIDDNRRKAYPFITCTNCGPRFSIINRLPFDRMNTEMDSFQMCSTCLAEYENPWDRRYYSQTNSCSECGVEMILYDSKQEEIARSSAIIIKLIVDYWKAGKIVAVKGIGGYLLTCDASNVKVVAELRRRKHRPTKPFALMVPSREIISLGISNRKIIEVLESHVSPIVLIEKESFGGTIMGIAPGLQQVGVMLPYTPLFDLLLQAFGAPIVATSGNISRSPIIYQDDKAFQGFMGIADYLLTNNRKIVVPQDDSVIKYSIFGRHKIVLRRARGLAPTYIDSALELPAQNIIAMGAMLKSTFSLLQQGTLYVSQYLGDLEQYDTQQNYKQVIQHFLELFKLRPDVMLGDLHPEYPSHQIGLQLAADWKIPFNTFQHHLAHFGAVLGEHDLLRHQSPVLGVIWDGMGLGEDGQIWGGEFFVYENYAFTRSCHFDYFDHILGDKMPNEPRISALSTCWELLEARDILREKFSEIEWKVYLRLLESHTGLRTSSIGRIFDAVASLLGVMDVQSYEGEAAMRLETLATGFFKESGFGYFGSYFEEVFVSKGIPTQFLMTQIINDLKKGHPKEFIAAKFHVSLVHLIKNVANHLTLKHLAFSGGVFQNALLVDLINHHLHEEFELYFHQELPCNDENISFGQIICYQISHYHASSSTQI